MKIIYLFTILIGSISITCGQGTVYFNLIKTADSLQNLKDYKNATVVYSKAFKTNGWKAIADDRYKSACCWAQINIPDSAFFQLTRIAERANYSDYRKLMTDFNLQTLQSDIRWNQLIELVKSNYTKNEEDKIKREINYNKPLILQLDTIYEDDQKYRIQAEEIAKTHGWESKEVMEIQKIIKQKDSINIIKINRIVEKFGWLTHDVAGPRGIEALFLVIQHSDLPWQEKYLPMMREAVKKRVAFPDELALLEDRVALRKGRKQIYGTQLTRNPKTQVLHVSPLLDPESVDQRRKEVGLEPIAKYLEQWQLGWDVEQYKKDLPGIEKVEWSGRK